jgi:hypothetical protein
MARADGTGRKGIVGFTRTFVGWGKLPRFLLTGRKSKSQPLYYREGMKKARGGFLSGFLRR